MTVTSPIRCLTIGGPTASQKSALALKLAEPLDGEIINGDSVQLYKDLRILTSRPSLAAEKKIPHHLYGILSLKEKSTVAWWVSEAYKKIQDISARQKFPIIVGGTGFYLKTLSEGISTIPSIPEEVKEQVNQKSKKLGVDFYDYAVTIDPLLKNKLMPQDHYRLSRALEVYFTTKKSITQWQGQRYKFPLEVFHCTVLPDKSDVWDSIEKRVDLMIEEGVIEEVETFFSKNFSIPENHPILKAIGLKEIHEHLLGNSSFNETKKMIVLKTRQYAKRQSTWFRNQMKSGIVLKKASVEAFYEAMIFHSA